MLLFWHLLTSGGTAKQAKRGGLTINGIKPVSILEKPFSNGEMQLRRHEVGFRARRSAVGGVTQGNRQREAEGFVLKCSFHQLNL